ncbi:MAG: 1-acyl-sn-glycerol-3-phosphate acyltransferase [Bacteroidota bacterium]
MNSDEIDLAVQANKKIFDEHFDLEFLKNLNEEIVSFLKLYFRPVFVGFEEMPDRKSSEHPIIFACNHSGMAFPWDAIIFGAGLMNMHAYELNKLFRPLASPMLSASSLMNPFLLRNLWKKVGAIDATGLNFETMMHYPDAHLLIYPEGVPGIGKGFNRKYQLQQFSTSMIRMAIKFDTEILGVSCINGEYINPFSYTSKRLNRLVNKLGIPYLPVAIQTPLLLLQPWLFYYAFPAKLTYVKGNRYRPVELLQNSTPDQPSMEDVARIRDIIQEDMQAELNKWVKVYGKKPYQWGELIRNMIQHWRDLPYWTPLGWPALFSEYDRRYHSEEQPPKGVIRGRFRFWRIISKNPIILAYFIPVLGWIPLLYKGLKNRTEVKGWEGSRVPSAKSAQKG